MKKFNITTHVTIERNYKGVAGQHQAEAQDSVFEKVGHRRTENRIPEHVVRCEEVFVEHTNAAEIRSLMCAMRTDFTWPNTDEGTPFWRDIAERLLRIANTGR